MLNNDEYTEVEGRYYLNPQTGLDESTSFIENLRATQGQQNQEIAEQTQNLGTDISSNLGGLGGDTDYWTARYQTPQTASAVANLRTVAQAAALNQALANEQAMWKKRYNDAYRAYQRRSRSSGGGGSSSGSNGNSNQSTWSGEPTLESTDGGEEPRVETQTEVETEAAIPPNPYSEEFNITGEEQTKRISERSGLPEWMVNILKVTTNP